MQAALYLASVALIALTLWDVFITVVSADGAGPLTRFWSDRLWSGLLRVHRRRPVHRLLSFTGPFILLASIVLWYVLLGAGMLLAFAAQPASVIDNATGAPADLAGKLYFVSSTISSLGYGDLVPSGFPWTMAGTLATLAATVIITISLSYVLSVLAAAIERRKLAQSIFGMGATLPGLIARVRLDSPEESLKNYILGLTSEIDHQALNHLAYPILKFFHAESVELSPARALLLLSDAFFVLGRVPDARRAPPGLQGLVESSIDNYVKYTSRNIISPRSTQGTAHLVACARDLGVSTEDQAFTDALGDYLPRRSGLVALCREDGWPPE